MELIETIRCESAEPWWSTQIESSSEEGRMYTVLVPWPDDGPENFICECPGFIHHGHCKHQTEVAANICRWDEATGPEEQEENNVCPRCEGPTITSLEIP